MKKPKSAVVKIRKRWGRNPQTKVKESDKCYLRSKEKEKARRVIKNESVKNS